MDSVRCEREPPCCVILCHGVDIRDQLSQCLATTCYVTRNRFCILPRDVLLLLLEVPLPTCGHELLEGLGRLLGFLLQHKSVLENKALTPAHHKLSCMNLAKRFSCRRCIERSGATKTPWQAEAASISTYQHTCGQLSGWGCWGLGNCALRLKSKPLRESWPAQAS